MNKNCSIYAVRAVQIHEALIEVWYLSIINKLNNPNFWLGVAILSFITGQFQLQAEVKLPDMFSHGMVLQQQTPVNLWGEAAPGEKVVVELSGDKAVAVADTHGKWRVKLPSRSAGGPYTMTVSGNNQLTIRDLWVGEVWLCSGQSNMRWNLKSTLTAEACAKVIAEANFPQLRQFWIEKNVARAPQEQLQGRSSWTVCQPNTAAGFSATAYFFGRELHRRLNVPVGVIVSAQGGTPSEAWTSLNALDSDPAYVDIYRDWQKRLANFPAAMKRYNEVDLPKWEAAVQQAQTMGKPKPQKPIPPTGYDHQAYPANLFNAMIAPLIPYTLRGIAWYQGESNADSMAEALQYYTLFPTLIRDWRARWAAGDIPFLFVQLANFRALQTVPVEDSSWPVLREAQSQTLALSNTGMAVAIDINNEPENIHPRNKEEIGRRLALVALEKVYKQKIVSSGPRYSSMIIEGPSIRVRFSHSEGGLKARSNEKPSKLTGFAIAGADGKFVWAHAVIEGDSVVLSNSEVASPTAVRYSWADNPIGNLYNDAGLPASPFRSDIPLLK